MTSISTINITYPTSTDVPLSAVLQAARRLLMECPELECVAITRTGPALDIHATVTKVQDSNFSFHLVENFDAVMRSPEKLITSEQKTEESGG